jgi:hypothetical protein
MDGSNPELEQPFAPPPHNLAHLEIHVNLKPPPEAIAPRKSDEAEIDQEKWWQDLEARWKIIVGLEASLETLRLSMEGIRSEMEGSAKKGLTADEKVHALNSDVAQWNKAKNRVHFALPKAREFIHRATWIMGTPERKQLEEVYKNHIQPHVPFPGMDKLPDQLENLLKDRQVLSAKGVAVHQECKGVTADIQATFRTVQSNAIARANQKRIIKKRSEAKSKGRL